ncbi:MAG TPA: hypothetical protein VKV41_25280 [Methylomirabilota bacterium]|nr:hypothetical protein [Methylomirabilota bacterium]
MAKHPSHRAEHPEHEPPPEEDEEVPPPTKEEPVDPDAPPKTQVIQY